MIRHNPAPVRLLADRRGVALPVALFGLVAVSLLVTSALITSSTEVALSGAHQDGTRALYAADGALEQFMAQRAAMVNNLDQRLATGGYQIALAGGSTYEISVAELFRSGATTLPGGAMERRETYSLVAEAQNRRGRSVGALVEVTRMASSISLDVDSGLTLGMNTTITGNATISDGSDSAACDSAAAPNAIRYSSDAEVSIGGNAGNNLVGDTIHDTRNASQLMSDILNGHSIESLADLAHIRFGPMYGKPVFVSGAGPHYNASNPSLRWGCPADFVDECPGAAAAYFPTVVIDANGGEVDITNYHGQGILIVRNGDLHIRGNFKYGGIVLVEGKLRVTGGGSNPASVNGAVIAMGDETVIDAGDESETSGTSVIRFDKCQIVEAQKGLTIQSLESSDQTIDTPTFAWFEVVR